MRLVLAVLILIAVIVVPVMLAARLVGAGKAGFGSVLFAVFLQICLSAATHYFVSSRVIIAVIAIVVGSAIYAFVLDTTWLRGFGISILSTVIAVVVVILLATTLAGFAPAT